MPFRVFRLISFLIAHLPHASYILSLSHPRWFDLPHNICEGYNWRKIEWHLWVSSLGQEIIICTLFSFTDGPRKQKGSHFYLWRHTDPTPLQPQEPLPFYFASALRIKFLIMNCFLATCYFLPRRFKCFRQHHVLIHPQDMCDFPFKTTFHTYTK
jgi:hypothetical protein